jgi:hypothetical protein
VLVAGAAGQHCMPATRRDTVFVAAIYFTVLVAMVHHFRGGGGGGCQHGMPETRHNTAFVAIIQHLWP